jgi:hypothetical protein
MEDVLARAGIRPGMRVLDIGLVDPTGSVLGVDRSSEAIETTARHAAQAGQSG